MSRCWKWDEPHPRAPQIQVKCDGTSGNWVAAEWANKDDIPADLQDDYNEALSNWAPNLALSELQCEPKNTDVLNVKIGELEATGGLLRCEIEDQNPSADQYTISAPNTCILLCDFQLGMTIVGELIVNGQYEFKIVETDETITDDKKIKCW